VSKNDVAKIKAVVRQYEAACRADDIEALAKTLANNVVWMPPDAPKISGKKAFVTWLKGAFFDPFKVNLKVKHDSVQVFGSQAVATGAFAVELTPKSGGPMVKAVGKHMELFKKQKDGSWKYDRLIFNYDKPPA
jgi:uncharacterized protein (TIGR02246 family)